MPFVQLDRVRGGGLRAAMVIAAAVGVLVSMQSRAEAGAVPSLQINIQSVAAAPGSTGNTLDVTLTNTGAAPINVGVVDLFISVASPDITFTDGTTGTVLAPYIFAGNSEFGPDIFSSAPGSTVATFDAKISFGSTTLTTGAVLGLAHLIFDVAPGTAPGPYNVTANPNTILTVADGDPFPFTVNPGTITISATTVVPEPASASLGLLGLLTLVTAATRRR